MICKRLIYFKLFPWVKLTSYLGIRNCKKKNNNKRKKKKKRDLERNHHKFPPYNIIVNNNSTHKIKLKKQIEIFFYLKDGYFVGKIRQQHTKPKPQKSNP